MHRHHPHDGGPTRRRRVAPIVGSLLAIVCVTGHGTASAASNLPVGDAGTYTLVPDSSDDIKVAIDRTVKGMNFITRPIARSRLSKINPTPQRVRVDLTADSVGVAFDDGNPVVTPLDGDTADWLNPLTGETDRAHATAAGDTLRQTITAHDGVRENMLVFSTDGERLLLRVTVTSHRLPRPLVYDLVFHKADAPSNASR